MLDLLIGLYLLVAALRGWRRGVVPELLDLGVLVLAVAAAFRLSGPGGELLARLAGLSPERATLAAGLALFVMAILVSGAAARLVPRPSGRPGLLGRVGGSVLALGWGLVSLVIVLSVARVLPLPPSFDRSLEGSRLAGAVAGEESVPRRAFQALAGEGALDELLVLEELFDSTRVVLDADDRVEFAPPPPDLVESSPEDARLVFRLVNEARAAAGRPPLAWFPELARVAAAHAAEMYRVGYVSHVSPTTGTVEDRVEAAGVTVRVVGENLALASSARAVHEGLMDSPGHRRNILSPRYDRLGVGAVSGPYGVMVVEVFGG